MWLYLIDLMFFLIETGGEKAISLGDVLHKTSELGLGSGFEFKRSTNFTALVKFWVPGQVFIFEGKPSFCSA